MGGRTLISDQLHSNEGGGRGEERAMHTAHRPDKPPEGDRLNANQGGDRKSLYSDERSES